ncbi:unnamed protein product, partial [Prorocentrum cordatum]
DYLSTDDMVDRTANQFTSRAYCAAGVQAKRDGLNATKCREAQREAYAASRAAYDKWFYS